jgi:hypothetical protein
MGASKREGAYEAGGTPVSAALSRATKLPISAIAGVAFFVIVVASVVAGWQRFGRTVVARPVYRIAAENIEITPPPPWIRTSIREEVVRDGALTDLTIFDRDVTIRVYQAFELHPWVAKVLRVSKQPPARLTVDLEYRRPVAWVEVAGSRPGDEGGVIPVDEEGHVLPSRDFTPEDLVNYPRISIPDLRPYGLAGSAWGDGRVVGAARIAAALPENWQSLRLYRIQLANRGDWSRSQAGPIYELETAGGQRIAWGNPPGAELPQEPSAEAKVQRLLQLAEPSGTLEQIPQTGLDLRETTRLPTADTAFRKLARDRKTRLVYNKGVR